MKFPLFAFALFLTTLTASTLAQQPAPASASLTYEGASGALKGRHFIFIASDHEYDHNFKGEDFKGGFGRQILGETWVGHYGPNHKSSTRLDIIPEKASHPVLTGVKDMWAEIGAYNANPIEGSEVLAMAQPLTGMTPDSPADETKKPMPGAWVRTYKSASGKDGRVFATTYGASGDLQNEGFRRMLVNACFWAAAAEGAIKADNDISIVGTYRPTWLGGVRRAKEVSPQDLSGWDSPILPEEKK